MFYFRINNTQGPLWSGSTLRLAQALQQIFVPCLLENGVLDLTIDAIKYMIGESNNSSAIRLLSPKVRLATEDTTPRLTEEELGWILG